MTIRPLELPDTTWAYRLADTIHTLDGARDSYRITLHVTSPHHETPTVTVQVWTRNHRDAEDTAAAFNAHHDQALTTELTQVWTRHYTDGGPDVEIITARPTPTTTVAATGVAA